MSDDRYAQHDWKWADEYPELYEDDSTCALWYRLVRLADMAWSAAATIPYGTKRRPLAALVDAGLVLMQTKTTYKIKGMDKRRQARSKRASTAARTRWGNAPSNAPSIAASNAETMPNKPEQNKAEQTKDADCMDAYYRLTGSWPSSKVVPWLNTLAADHGEAAVSEALAAEWAAEMDRATLLSRTQTRLEREAHEGSKRRKEQQRAAAEAERKRMEEGMSDEQRAANRARLRDMAKAAGLTT